MANIPHIDYNKLEEFYTIPALRKLFHMEKLNCIKSVISITFSHGGMKSEKTVLLSMTSESCIICCIMRTTMDILRTLQRMMIRGYDRYSYRQGSSATAQDNTPADSKDDFQWRTSCR